MKSFPFYRQLDSQDCGPACLRMISKYYGKFYSVQKLRARSFTTKQGSSLTGLSQAAESIGFKVVQAKISTEKLLSEAPLPLICHWKSNHYIVVFDVRKDKIDVADPAFGVITYKRKEFESNWIKTNAGEQALGYVLMLEPTIHFHDLVDGAKENSKWNLSILLKYLIPYRRLLFQLLIGMVAGSMIQLMFPLITQSLVDKGIGGNNLNFIHVILIAQLTLVASRMTLGVIQNRIFLFMNGRVSIALLSDFLTKLLKLPLSFFNSRNVGNILQRVTDNSRVQAFLTGATLSTLFSIFNFCLFGVILAWYSMKIFLVFMIGSILHGLWIVKFLKKRKELDYKSFDNSSRSQNGLIEMINGMQEIKLSNGERHKRWEWEQVQTNAYLLGVKSLNLVQYQETGSFLINEVKNIIITFLTAVAVLKGDITLGMMMSVQYIIGSLNVPITTLLSLIQNVQDVKISLQRLGEIHEQPNEEDDLQRPPPEFFKPASIHFKNVSFSYDGPNSQVILKNISVSIPLNKTTAIVGPSGSGKSTLLKLLLRLYNPNTGEIYLGERQLGSLNIHFWRSRCAAVMQDGYIFSDTIAKNITMSSSDDIDYDKLQRAMKLANIKDYVDSLIMNYNTIIGSEGNGLSQGQRQRILIARAIYRDPDYLLLDEATNSLDSQNEKSIMENLQDVFVSKTVVVVAHRLSTVVQADKIIVLDRGQISEVGVHNELIARGGLYYSLVRNQLELNQ